LGVYGRSKLAGEGLVRTACPGHVIVRTAWLYSPFGRNFVRTIVEAARTRDTLRVVNDQRGSPTSALDLADALLAMLGRWRAGDEVGLGQTYHVAGSGETSWCGLASHIMAQCERLGLPFAAVEPIGTGEWPTRAARPRNSVLDSAKFAADFGVRMPDWRMSVDQTVARLAANA
jgi:dTDP-4-dehydrorhamnose reductase